jgi:hypothetical protein
LSGECFHDNVPAFFEGLDTFFEFLIFAVSFLLFGAVLICSDVSRRRDGCGDGEGKSHASAKSSVLFFQLCYSVLEIGELSFTAVTGVLSCDTITVSTSFSTVFRGSISATSFTGSAGGVVGRSRGRRI